MGLGSTAKKVQRLSDIAEKLYEQVNEVLERLSTLHDRVEGAAEDVEAVRREQREQRAILEAIGAEQGVDVDAVVANVEHPADGRGDGADHGTDGGGDGADDRETAGTDGRSTGAKADTG